MKQYLDLLQKILDEGVNKGDRTGTGMRELFGAQLRFNLQDGFPLLTTKKMFLKGITHELLWFLKGDTNIKYLTDNDVHIWDAWADENGDLGPVYGSQWRKWWYADREGLKTAWDLKDPYRYLSHEVDQIANLIDEIKTKPNSRRMIVTAWNPAEVDNMALPPCHLLMQFSVEPYTWKQRVKIHKDQNPIDVDIDGCGGRIDSLPGGTSTTIEEDIEYITKKLDQFGVPKGKLHCQMYQRSADMFLGVPFNIASYSMLTMMIAQVCGLKPGNFIHTFGSAHIYFNHMDQVTTQLGREPHPLPTMTINPEVKSIDDFKYEDFTLSNYEYDPGIKAPIAV